LFSLWVASQDFEGEANKGGEEDRTKVAGEIKNKIPARGKVKKSQKKEAKAWQKTRKKSKGEDPEGA